MTLSIRQSQADCRTRVTDKASNSPSYHQLLYGSLVEHRSVDSEGLAFDSFGFVFSFFRAHEKTKNSLSISSFPEQSGANQNRQLSLACGRYGRHRCSEDEKRRCNKRVRHSGSTFPALSTIISW